MSIAVVTSASAASSDTNDAVISGVNTTGATLLVCAVSSYDAATIPAVSDNKSNTWTPLTVYNGAGGFAQVRFYYAQNPTVGTGHNFTASSTGGYPSIALLALSGTAIASVFDAENGSFSTVGETSHQTGSVSPAADNEILISSIGIAATGTDQAINGGFTIHEAVAYGGGTNFGIKLASLIQTAAAAANPTWSWTSDDAVAVNIAAFKEAGGGGGGTPFFTQLGAKRI